jgi:hypothetical protein
MSDLAARLRAVVEERLTVAGAATPGPWTLGIVYGTVMRTSGGHVARTSSETNATHIALNDPADVILACERDLAVLERHAHHSPNAWCGGDIFVGQPCAEIRDLATRYRVEVDG